jgi:hypothetical protein
MEIYHRTLEWCVPENQKSVVVIRYFIQRQRLKQRCPLRRADSAPWTYWEDVPAGDSNANGLLNIESARKSLKHVRSVHDEDTPLRIIKRICTIKAEVVE